MSEYTFTELGKETRYSDSYDANLLCPIPRVKARQSAQAPESLPFVGVDVWTAYELSWLNLDGLPQIAIVEFIVPCDSDSIVIGEKIFRLYQKGPPHSFVRSRSKIKKSPNVTFKQSLPEFIVNIR